MVSLGISTMNFELHTCCIQFIQEDSFLISGGISGSPISYTAHAFNYQNNISFNSSVSLSSCEEGNECPIELPSSYCSQSTFIDVTISAGNKLGEGPRSNPFIIGKIVLYMECLADILMVYVICIMQNASTNLSKWCTKKQF